MDRGERFFAAGYPPVPVVRLSVKQYHRMTELGVLFDGDPIELLTGWLVPKYAPDDLPRDSLPAERLPDVPTVPVWRMTVADYHRMIDADIFPSGDRIELLEGWLVPKMTKNPPHMVACELLADALRTVLPAGWFLKFEAPLSLIDSEPEPDLMIVAGSSRDYIKRHPSVKDVGLVIEVADSSRVRDLGIKKRLYARSKVAEYWVLDLTKSRLEVFTQPSGPGDEPDFGTRQVFTAKQRVPVVLKGKKIASVLINDVLP